MDNNPNFLNPNVPPPAGPDPITVQPQMPAMPQMSSGKKVSTIFIVVILLVLAAAGAAWWYITQMVEEPVIQEVKIDEDARQDTLLSGEIESTDLGDVDKEFQDVDKDLNSL